MALPGSSGRHLGSTESGSHAPDSSAQAPAAGVRASFRSLEVHPVSGHQGPQTHAPSWAPSQPPVGWRVSRPPCSRERRVWGFRGAQGCSVPSSRLRLSAHLSGTPVLMRTGGSERTLGAAGMTGEL